MCRSLHYLVLCVIIKENIIKNQRNKIPTCSKRDHCLQESITHVKMMYFLLTSDAFCSISLPLRLRLTLNQITYQSGNKVSPAEWRCSEKRKRRLYCSIKVSHTTVKWQKEAGKRWRGSMEGSDCPSLIL